ncbi:helix-turn-helix domain-containing protein [Salinilacihabitans rarus]|uniref:helix-turn-helix domain-containing protein n=1 Tax=Salinilacihabitans rarus TaxID=2961596 RepID=UPI0020C8B3A9|nr:helix-turn-helix domain-containing protein [Salinilacihabitans rarus]
MTDCNETPLDVITVEECLNAVLRITPHPDSNCPILDAIGSSREVMQSICHNNEEECDECRAKLRTGESDATLVKTNVHEKCICSVIRSHDCISSVDAFEDDDLIVSLSTCDREQIFSIISSLKDTGAEVRLQQLTTDELDEANRSFTLEVDGFTDKQLEAVEVAVSAGYYDVPRRTDLADISNRLGITRSAVSNRLCAAERKLVRELFEAIR